MSSSQPTVSVIIPARDAADVLPNALKSIASQTYPNIVEVIVAAGDDSTAEAAGTVRVVHNPSGTTPAGLNLALKASHGDVVVRCDAQAVLPDGYVAQAVETMERTGAANVGGMQVPVGTTRWERAIAAAMTSPLGSGDAKYRLGGEEGPVETVYLGVFRREIFEEVGGFDEHFLRNQDYELNHRITRTGGLIWFNPALKVEYRPRGSLRELAKQYYEYGKAKRQFSRRHPRSLRPRQLAPPLFLLILTLSLLGSLVTPWLVFLPLSYLLTLLLVGLGANASFWQVASSLMTMHLAWGAGFFTG